MTTKGLLLFYHYRSNIGYAIEPLERAFFQMAVDLTKDLKRVHIGYPDLIGARPQYVPENFNNFLQIDTRDSSVQSFQRIYEYIKLNQIEIAFGFDQPVSRPAYKTMRQAGVRLFVSYQGQRMSGYNRNIKLAIKKFEVFLRRNKPDHYIFESNGMAATAIFGRGIPAKYISVIPLGVNIEKYWPDPVYADYAYTKFSIPRDRRIIFYMGHMHEGKGVHIIVKAANDLICKRNRRDVHFLLLGNRDGEELRFDSLYKGRNSAEHITFGGYQNDIPMILPSCYLGVIASTGWDSFTMSSIEMAACGLPVIVSDSPGLNESIESEKTGFLFPVGDYYELSNKIEMLLNDPEKHRQMSIAGRQRVVEKFSVKHQIENLTNLLEKLAKAKGICK